MGRVVDAENDNSRPEISITEGRITPQEITARNEYQDEVPQHHVEYFHNASGTTYLSE